jgi:hypothetical protein
VVIRCHSLAHSKLTRQQRLGIGVALAKGHAVLDGETLTHSVIAAVLGIPLSALTKALAQHNDGPRRRCPDLCELLKSASPEQRLQAAKVLGPSVVWDQMVQPLVS